MISQKWISIPLFVFLSLSACATPIATPATDSAASPTLQPTATEPPPAAFPQSQTVNGIEIELLDARIQDNFLTLDICYTLPVSQTWDWLPDDTVLTANNEPVSWFGLGLIRYQTAPDGTYTHRCDSLQFDQVDPATQKFTLRIANLATSIPERPDCAAAQSKLDEAQTGIKVSCPTAAHTGGFTVIEKPSTMSEDTASQIAYDAFVEKVEGPWVFNIVLPGPLAVVTSTPLPTPAAMTPVREDQIATVGGVDVLVIGMLVDEALYATDICYTLPSLDYEWNLALTRQDININIEGQTVFVDSISYTGFEGDYPNLALKYRCQRLSFSVPADSDTSQITLTVNHLYGFSPGAGCDQSEIKFIADQAIYADKQTCAQPTRDISGPWIIQTGLAR